MLIFLIGYMGSGKSTTGKKLARRLGLPFYDLDLLISTHQGLSIPEIFQQKGEAQFRNVEAAQLRTLNENDHAVVSTGGGTPCHHHNMQWMNQHGYTIYLKMPAKALYHRLAQAKEQRPLLTQQEDPLTFITQHLKAREPFYQKARLVVDAHTLTLDDLEEKLKPLLSYPLF